MRNFINFFFGKLIVGALLVATMSGLSAQTPRDKNTLAAIKLNTRADTLQYTLGAFIGQWITNNGFSITNQELFKNELWR